MLQSRAARNAACARTYFDPSIRLPGRLDLVPRFRLISGLERTEATTDRTTRPEDDGARNRYRTLGCRTGTVIVASQAATDQLAR